MTALLTPEMLKVIGRGSPQAMEDVRECRREYQEMVATICDLQDHRECF